MPASCLSSCPNRVDAIDSGACKQTKDAKALDHNSPQRAGPIGPLYIKVSKPICGGAALLTTLDYASSLPGSNEGKISEPFWNFAGA